MINFMNQFPKLMEVVGLGYTLWFSWRYLLFKVAILREIWAFIFHRHDDLITVCLWVCCLHFYRKIEMSWPLKLKNSSNRSLAQMMIDMKETIGFAQPYLQKMNVDQKVIARHFGSSYRMVSISVQGSTCCFYSFPLVL